MWTLDSYYDEFLDFLQPDTPVPTKGDIEDFFDEGISPSECAARWEEHLDSL
jgi:hypothetical protein